MSIRSKERGWRHLEIEEKKLKGTVNKWILRIFCHYENITPSIM